jgi:hypothetical protein
VIEPQKDFMGSTIDQKIEQLVVPNGMPHPNLMESILREGDAAIPPLIEFLNQEVKSDERELAVEYVAHILGSLVARQAIPALVKLFQRKDITVSNTYEATAATLARLDAVDDLLELLKDYTIPLVAREYILYSLQDVAIQSEQLSQRICDEFYQLLNHYVHNLESRGDDVIVLGMDLMNALAYLGAEDPLGLMEAASDMDPEWCITYVENIVPYRMNWEEPVVTHTDWYTEYKKAYFEFHKE